MSDVSSHDAVDVAIVGGGVSGLYAGWRLATGTRTPVSGSGVVPPAARRVAIFEASNRVGGRTCTVTDPEMPHVPIELGAEGFYELDSRFTPGRSDPAHPWPGDVLVHLLAEKFRLPSEPIGMGNDQNRWFLRGRSFAQGSLSDPRVVPYDLQWIEGTNIASMLAFACGRVVPGATGRTAQQWWERRRTDMFDGRPLHDLTLADTFASTLSREGQAFLRESAEDELVFDQWNAADAIPEMLSTLSGSQPIRLFSDGFQTLPDALAREFRDAGGAIALEHALERVSVEPGSSPRWRLRFVLPDGGRYDVVAASLILALPVAALTGVCDRSPEFMDAVGPEFRRDVESVAGVRARKTYLRYPAPWWRRFATTSGFVTTDTDLRSLFYFQTEGERPGAASPDNQNSLLLASLRTYADSPPPYTTTALPPGIAQPRTVWPGGPGGGGELLRALSPQALDAVQRLVCTIHATTDLPAPRSGLDIIWDESNPYGFGWCYWKRGVRSWDVQQRMRRPRGAHRVFVCGCSYSNEQGWVNGALTSAEQVVRESFGVPQADWMPFDYLPY